MRLSFLVPLVFAGVCFAQTSRPAGGQQALQAFLGLTDQQMTQLRQMRQQQMQAERPAMQQINSKQRELNQLLATPGADPAAVGKLMIEIANLRKSAPQPGRTLQNQALAVLTPEQKTKLTQLQEAQKLIPAINQATMLGLIEPLERPAGMGPLGFGPEGRRGRMQGRGPIR
jgi:Spy/CpxP family protein refolding chaperone